MDTSLNLPSNFHMAIIMDGNGRWGKMHKGSRLAGHEAGVKRFEELFQAATDFGVKYLTLFAFSTENWKRSEAEVQGLMMLFRSYITRETERLLGEDVRVRFLGDKSAFPKDLIEAMEILETRSSKNDGLHLNVAMNYGGQDEITRAVRKIVASGVSADEVTPELIENHLDTYGQPPIDLLLRTSGETRISNFTLWQAAYSEFVFIDTLWPDFDRSELRKSLEEFENRSRRYGGT